MECTPSSGREIQSVLALASQFIELLHILLDLVPVGLDVHDGHQCDLDLHGQLHGQGT